jgi:hypothetical protein
MWEKAENIEAAIRRLTREIEDIDQFFYKANETDDRLLYAGMLERKRDDVVRAAVLQMHTAIEDIMNSHIFFQLTGQNPRSRSRSSSARAVRKMLFGGGSLGFEMKLNLALALRVINSKIRDRLVILNALRNKCSHNWILRIALRQGKRPKQKKPPLLLYEGRDLHRVDVLKEFVSEYSGIYLKLFLSKPD